MEIKELKGLFDNLNKRNIQLDNNLKDYSKIQKIDYFNLNKRLNKLEKKKWYQFIKIK